MSEPYAYDDTDTKAWRDECWYIGDSDAEARRERRAQMTPEEREAARVAALRQYMAVAR